MRKPEDYLGNTVYVHAGVRMYTEEQSLEAIRACLKDHDDYCKEMLALAEELSKKAEKALKTIEEINLVLAGVIQQSSGNQDQSPFVE